MKSFMFAFVCVCLRQCISSLSGTGENVSITAGGEI